MSSSTKWFVCPQKNPEPEIRFFLFPYAGGGPSVFNKWSNEFPSNIEIQIVHYPGRGSRSTETAINSLPVLIEKLSQAIQPLLDKSFVFFGHSLGGLIAFELAKRLRTNELSQPKIIFISSCGAPQIPDPNPSIHTFPENEFINSLNKMNGIPQEILKNQELMNLILPILRADFELVETYEYISDEPLDCPIIAIGGLDDERISRERLEGWAAHTRVRFNSLYFPGNHFFINSAKGAVIETVLAEIGMAANPPSQDD